MCHVDKMCKFVVSVIWVLFLCYFANFLNVQIAEAVILSPCKVQNMITQPKYGTSLKTRSLVNIVQMPPVFIQNVMIGICENQNQNISSGRPGEFFQCEQRYSAVEVYVAETSSVPIPSSPNSNPNIINEINYIRESVIIESGCDFTFNLLPLIMNLRDMEGHQSSPPPPPPPQQTTYLRSPFHPNMPGMPGNQRQPPPQLMQPPGTAVPIPVHQNHQIPQAPSLTYPTYTQARSGTDENEDQPEEVDEEQPIQDKTHQTQFMILKK